MLDFYFIADSLPSHAQGLAQAGGIEYEEFENAQELKIIENHLDYYGKLRWSSQQVQQKWKRLIPAITTAIPNLAFLLKQALAAKCGLVAFGD